MVTRALTATGVFGILVSVVMASWAGPAVAATGINKQVNFQGKVVNSNGTNVTDGSYGFVFKLYSVSSGGSAIWTESKTLTVTDGIFQTNLGSVTGLPGSVDFNTDNIYLGINFNTDGEMSPRIQFTASPYAFNSDLLDGLDSSAFAQLNPASAQSGSLNVTGSVQAATSLQAPLVDTATASALSIGTGTATSVTVGRTSTSFTIQGNASSVFTATNGANTTTVSFVTPTGTNAISFPDAGGTLCTTVATTCSATYQAASATGYLLKNAQDTSSASVTGALLALTNTSTSGNRVLDLTNQGTGSTLNLVANANPGAGAALLKVNNQAGSPSGNLVDLQQGGTSRFAVAQSGAVTRSSNAQGTDADSLTANSLTTGAALRVTSSNNSAANTPWSAVALAVTNAQGTTAVSGGTIAGLDVQFAQSATVAGNTETVANLAVAANSGSPADSVVGSILNLANNDTATGNQIAVTDALKINGANVTNGINLSGTFGTNLITASNFSVSQAGAVVGVGVNSGTGLIQGTGGLTATGAVNLNIGAATGAITLGGGAAPLAIDSTNFDVSSAGGLSGITGYAQASGNFLQSGSGTFGTGTGAVSLGGVTVVQPTATSTAAFSVKTPAGGTNANVFTVDTTNSRVGIALGGSTAPTLAHEGLEVKGALRLSGSSSAYVDTFTTPVGSGVDTKINIPLYDPGGSGQVLAFGLPSGAATNSRAISVFDRRGWNGSSYVATPVQPAVGLFSPDENNILGFSWEGTTTTGYLKTTGGNIAVRSGSTDLITALSGGNVGIGLSPSYKLDVNGDANIASGSAYKIGGTNVCTASGCTATAASAILNQNAAQQTSANFWISGTGRLDTSLQTPLLDTATAVALAVGTTNATAINLNQNTTVAAGKNLSLASGAGTFAQAFTGTGDAHTITANALTTGSAFKVTSANNTAANTAWSAISLNPTNAQATTAVSGANLIAGLDLEFVQAATVAGNTETVANLAVAANGGSPADSTVASILNLANNDTATGNQITVTDALKIQGANVTNGINFSGTFGTNLITASNFSVTGSGDLTAAGTITGSTAVKTISLDTPSAGALSIGSATATSVAIGRMTQNFTLQGAAGLGGSKITGTGGGFTSALTFATPTNTRALVLPDEGGTLCIQNSANCGFLLGSAGSYIINQTSQQASSNFNISNTGVAGVSLVAPLFATADVASGSSAGVTLRSGNGTAANASSGNVTIDAGSKNGSGFAGNVNIGATNALNVNIGRNAATASGVAVSLQGLAASSSFIFNDATNTNQLTLTSATPTGARSLVLPDTSGTLCADSGNCDGTTGTGYILNRTGTTQTGNYQISGTGRANTSLLTPLLDTPSGTTTLNIGTTNATAGINLNQNVTVASGKSVTVQGAFTQSGGAVSITSNAAAVLTTTSGALTITSAAAATWSTAAGDLGVSAAANLNLNGTAVNVGAVGVQTAASSVHIADTTSATGAQVVTIGSTAANAGNITTVQGGSAAGGGVVLAATTVGLAAANVTFTSGGARTLSVAAAASGAGNSLTIKAGTSGTGANNGGNLVLQAGATGGSGTTGSVVVKANGTDSATAFDVQNASGVSQFAVDTVGSQVITQGMTLQSNTITPSAAMTVGSTTQTLTLQGGNSTKITATNGANTVSVNFATIAGAGTYQFASPTTNTTYTICTSDLNSCGAGSTGYLRKGTANETSSANLTAGQFLYQFSNNGSLASNVLVLANGTGTASTLKVTAAANAGAGEALIYAKLTNASVGGNLIDLWSGPSGTETSKFSVNAAGAVTTASTINGQTISSTASFTGTVGTGGLLTASSLTVTNAATFSSGATVNTAALTANAGASIFSGINNNAGGITSAGAVSGLSSLQFNTAGTIDANAAVAVSIGTTNASTLNIGRAGGTLSLQGNTSSALTVSNGTNTTSLQFANPTGNIIYQFAAGTAGTYQLCSTLAATCGTTYAAYYANGYIQLAPGTAQADASANPSIFINKSTVSANYLLRLQANAADVFGVQANGIVTAAGTTYLGGTSSSYAMQVDTANFKVRIGTGTPTLGSGGANATAALYVSGSSEFAGTIRVGDGTNNATFDATTKEVTFAGTARHASAVRLTGEFAGAVLDADGSNNTGTMTAAYESTQRFGYYKWVTSQGTAQDYDIVATVPVPDDFSAWTGSPTFWTYGSAGSSMSVTITDTAGTVATNYNASALTVSTTWTARSVTTPAITGTYTQGSNMIVRIHLTAAATTGDVRLGTITLPYLTRW
ncbi:MAG TPA: hypothetical protein VMT30_00205 [Candidatus Saccharimonadia bacterium]|nr:hypothetical protein [Candidatus Saccharimonadia bacterium]